MAHTDTFFHRLGQMFKPQRRTATIEKPQSMLAQPQPVAPPADDIDPSTWEIPMEIDDLSQHFDDLQIDGLNDNVQSARAIAQALAGTDNARLSSTADELRAKAEELRALSGELMTDLDAGDSSDSIAAAPAPDAVLMRSPSPSRADAVAIQMQTGMAALTDLVGSIQQNLVRQNERQDQLISHLSALPKALETLPKLGDILQQVANTNDTHQRVLDALQVRVEQFHQNNEMIAFNLSGVGAAIATVSRTSQASAEVLGQVHADIAIKTSQLHQAVKSQGRRFTLMLGIAIALSVTALAAVGTIGGLVLMRLR
jgi:hypothetical protein